MIEAFKKLGTPVGSLVAPIRVDTYLANHFQFLSRSGWVKRIQKQELLINRKVAKPSQLLFGGEQIYFFHPEDLEPQVNTDLQVIYQDEYLAIIDKPAPLPMHEGGAYRKKTFSHLLVQLMGEGWSALHRLDRETSGLVICSKHEKTRAAIAAMFRQNQIKKTYHAIAFGQPSLDEWVVDQPTADMPESQIRIKRWVREGGNPSYTAFKLLAQKENFALIEAQPRTGRTNQIRIHAAFSGHHLVGDKMYYPDESVFIDFWENGMSAFVRSHVISDRCFLHAKRLVFTHPITSELIDVYCPMPQDMQHFWLSN